MRIPAAALCLALLAAPAGAETIDAKAAATHIGQTVTVVGVLTNVHQSESKTIFLDVGGTFPDNAFTAVIFTRDAAKFSNLAFFVGKKIAITGRIKTYGDKPEIVLSTADHLKLVK
jgi:predicted extracellular nuclease